MNVLVIFHSEDKEGEKLALSLALGAVQARSDIRLRRLGTAQPESAMHQGYIAPREQDLQWADALVLAIAPRNYRLRSGIQEFLAQLEKSSGDHLS